MDYTNHVQEHDIFYVMYHSTAVDGRRERHISRPFASLRDAKWYADTLPTSREPRILKEVTL